MVAEVPDAAADADVLLAAVEDADVFPDVVAAPPVLLVSPL